MKTKLMGACSALLVLGTSLPAQAAFVIQGGSSQGLPIAGNKFNTQMTALGFDQMVAGGQLRVSQDGYIDFYYIGAESGFNNSFTAESTGPAAYDKGSLSEHNEGFKFSGYDGFTIAVAANDIVNFSFSSINTTALNPVDNFTNTNLQGLGILFDSGQSGTLQQVLVGYDDQIYNDDNDFEDMLIRADFRPGLPVSDVSVSIVPLPAAAWLFGAGLIGLIGFAKRETA